MPTLRVRSVDIGEHTVLLDDEHVAAQAVGIVELLRGEIGEARELPVDQAGVVAPATFAR
jgi:hypothetical protein